MHNHIFFHPDPTPFSKSDTILSESTNIFFTIIFASFRVPSMLWGLEKQLVSAVSLGKLLLLRLFYTL